LQRRRAVPLVRRRAPAVTGAGGEIIVLDSGGYGPVTINQSVAIRAPAGICAGISVFANNLGTGNGVLVSSWDFSRARRARQRTSACRARRSCAIRCSRSRRKGPSSILSRGDNTVADNAGGRSLHANVLAQMSGPTSSAQDADTFLDELAAAAPTSGAAV
jgi:hypothetical protein